MTSPAAASFAAINQVKYGGLTATLTRGTQSCPGVAVNPAKSLNLLDAGGAGGARLEELAADFIVRASDYAFAGIASLPQKGDRLAVILNGQMRIFALVEPPFSPHDHGREFHRLHAEQVAA